MHWAHVYIWMSFSWAGHQENVENWIRKLQEIVHPKKIVLNKNMDIKTMTLFTQQCVSPHLKAVIFQWSIMIIKLHFHTTAVHKSTPYDLCITFWIFWGQTSIYPWKRPQFRWFFTEMFNHKLQYSAGMEDYQKIMTSMCVIHSFETCQISKYLAANAIFSNHT